MMLNALETGEIDLLIGFIPQLPARTLRIASRQLLQLLHRREEPSAHQG